MPNTTLISADRTTHLKIVGVAVIASVAVGLVGFNARGMRADSSARLQSVPAQINTGNTVQSNQRFPTNSMRGTSRANNQTSGGSNV